LTPMGWGWGIPKTQIPIRSPHQTVYFQMVFPSEEITPWIPTCIYVSLRAYIIKLYPSQVILYILLNLHELRPTHDPHCTKSVPLMCNMASSSLFHFNCVARHLRLSSRPQTLSLISEVIFKILLNRGSHNHAVFGFLCLSN
jgi:hypothetical protein